MTKKNWPYPKLFEFNRKMSLPSIMVFLPLTIIFHLLNSPLLLICIIWWLFISILTILNAILNKHLIHRYTFRGRWAQTAGIILSLALISILLPLIIFWIFFSGHFPIDSFASPPKFP